MLLLLPGARPRLVGEDRLDRLPEAGEQVPRQVLHFQMRRPLRLQPVRPGVGPLRPFRLLHQGPVRACLPLARGELAALPASDVLLVGLVPLRLGVHLVFVWHRIL